jgi:hypothetical protein
MSGPVPRSRSRNEEVPTGTSASASRIVTSRWLAIRSSSACTTRAKAASPYQNAAPVAGVSAG